jgi:hypothetical protein
MGWILAPNIRALIDSFNALSPGRGKRSDGTIGDTAHSHGVSGHNPDDTPGVRAEYSDSDRIAEVRAGDIDDDTRIPVTMEDCVQAILRNPGDRIRLAYIIYNRRIWSKSDGWNERRYTGDSPHTEHAHFSGDPNYDTASAPFLSITRLAIKNEVDELSATAEKLIAEIADRMRYQDGRIEAMTFGYDKVRDAAGFKGAGTDVWIVKTLKDVQTRLTAIETRLNG